MLAPPLKPPFPWFGGKTLAAPLIWQALGNVPNFVEPFFGAGATLLLRPHAPKIETINDKDALVCNVWRAIQADPVTVAQWAEWPVNEADLHAIHVWLLTQLDTLTERCMGDPDYYDAKVAGRWLWGICAWIGHGWCAGNGPWQSRGGCLVRREASTGKGVSHRIPHLGDAGQGVHRQLPHLGNAGQGVHRLHVRGESLTAWMQALAARLRAVRVCCGDWMRVMGDSVTWKQGLTGLVLDPPYSAEECRDPRLYRTDDLAITHSVRAWCLDNGGNPLLRIVLCGYDTVHDELLAHGWRKVAWNAYGGYSVQNKDQDNTNSTQERLWLSPACLRTETERQLAFW